MLSKKKLHRAKWRTRREKLSLQRKKLRNPDWLTRFVIKPAMAIMLDAMRTSVIPRLVTSELPEGSRTSTIDIPIPMIKTGVADYNPEDKAARDKTG